MHQGPFSPRSIDAARCRNLARLNFGSIAEHQRSEQISFDALYRKSMLCDDPGGGENGPLAVIKSLKGSNSYLFTNLHLKNGKGGLQCIHMQVRFYSFC